MLPFCSYRNLVGGLHQSFLDAHLVDIRSVGGMMIADHHFTLIAEAYPGMDTGDFVIGHNYLATGRITTDEQSLGADREVTTRQESCGCH